MVKKCSLCGNESHVNKITLHLFREKYPDYAHYYQKLLKLCNISEADSLRNVYVCVRHFDIEKIATDNQQKQLNSGVNPSADAPKPGGPAGPRFHKENVSPNSKCGELTEKNLMLHNSMIEEQSTEYIVNNTPANSNVQLAQSNFGFTVNSADVNASSGVPVQSTSQNRSCDMKQTQSSQGLTQKRNKRNRAIDMQDQSISENSSEGDQDGPPQKRQRFGQQDYPSEIDTSKASKPVKYKLCLSIYKKSVCDMIGLSQKNGR